MSSFVLSVWRETDFGISTVAYKQAALNAIAYLMKVRFLSVFTSRLRSLDVPLARI